MSIEEIKKTIDAIGDTAKAFAPGFAGYIVLGQIFAKLAPEIYVVAVKLVNGEKPTEAEKQDCWRKIRELNTPEKIR